MKGKKVWGVFIWEPVERWQYTWWGMSNPTRRRHVALQRRKAALGYPDRVYRIIPGTILPDGSVAWPKKWPAP